MKNVEMEKIFNRLINLKIDAQSLASFFQNDFEGIYPEYIVEDFIESIHNFMNNIEEIEVDAVNVMKNKK